MTTASPTPGVNEMDPPLCGAAVISHNEVSTSDHHVDLSRFVVYGASHERRVVYLIPAEKYHRLTCRLSHKGNKAEQRRLSGHHNGSLSPRDALDAGRTNARGLFRRPPLAAPPRLAHRPTGWGHGGTRHSRTSLNGPT